jgi:LemA protein
MSTGRIILIAVIAILALSIFSGVNSIPRQDEQVNAAWAEVENQYQRRADLVPNLVETVKGVANFEKTTLTDVIEARANATKITLSPDMLTDPEAVKKFQDAQGALSSTLSRLMVVSEQYPELKANQNFLSLQSQLEGTENRISVARRDYIVAVYNFNITVRSFPTMIWAKITGAHPKANFAASEASNQPPAVKF